MTSDINNIPNELVLEFMRTRRSVPVKLMGGPGPNKSQLIQILEIASRVPDHGKLVPWRFIHYGQDKCLDLGEKILTRARERAQQDGQELSQEFAEIERQRFTHAPVVVAVVSTASHHVKIPQWEQLMASGAVAMNMLIAANAFGFDAQWLTEWFAYDDALREGLGLNNEERITGFIHIGTRKNAKTERNRPDIDSIYSLMER